MNKVEELYGEEYCLKNSLKGWRFDEVPQIVDILVQHFHPKSVIDFGCSNGLHLKKFSELGVKTFGVEGTASFAPYIVYNYDGPFLIMDLRNPFLLGKKYELGICIEVLEHIEKEFAAAAVENICNHADVLCISTSPTKTARLHVNAQNKPYWIKKFESSGGFEYKDEETGILQSKFSYFPQLQSNWMSENLTIFRRKE
jgi:2-polyprenyl-3-methyl-5-hydroxy-6-metoxy-1,4-benzoquinol methylase